jgi:epoxide hydrolase-like predicted phosphatase
MKLKTLVFDMGGVILTIDQQQAVRHFEEIGVEDAAQLLDPYRQTGFFGLLEEGKCTEEQFRQKLSEHVGKPLTLDQCRYGWLGYFKEVPMRNLEYLKQLQARGYRTVLLSNTNPFVWSFVDSAAFDGGQPISTYFDAVYTSYQTRLMKPDPQFFIYMMQREKLLPSETLFVDDSPRNCASASQLGINTYCPTNGEDWTVKLDQLLAQS